MADLGMKEPQGLWSGHLLRFVSAHSRGGSPGKEARVPGHHSPHEEQHAPGCLLLKGSALCTWQQAGPQGILCLQRNLHRTPDGSCYSGYVMPREGPTDLCPMKAGPGVGHLYSTSPRERAPLGQGDCLLEGTPGRSAPTTPGLGKEKRLGGQPAHLGLPELVRQGADFTKCPH